MTLYVHGYWVCETACLQRCCVFRPWRTDCISYNCCSSACINRLDLSPAYKSLFVAFAFFVMHLTNLNQECLLHLFSFLDKDSRRNLSLTCKRLREAFLDPQFWSLLNFFSPSELTRNNFIVGPFLRYLNICWHSSRVKVCNIEDYKKTIFQRDLCSKHASLVSHFLECVCHMCPNLRSLTLSGCGHITDEDVINVLRCCRRLRQLCLENCCRVTDAVLQAVVTHGGSLQEVRVDFCRNVTHTGLQTCREKKPAVRLVADRSAGMIPDNKPEEKLPIRRALQKVLIFT